MNQEEIAKYFSTTRHCRKCKSNQISAFDHKPTIHHYYYCRKCCEGLMVCNNNVCKEPYWLKNSNKGTWLKVTVENFEEFNIYCNDCRNNLSRCVYCNMSIFNKKVCKNCEEKYKIMKYINGRINYNIYNIIKTKVYKKIFIKYDIINKIINKANIYTYNGKIYEENKSNMGSIGVFFTPSYLLDDYKINSLKNYYESHKLDIDCFENLLKKFTNCQVTYDSTNHKEIYRFSRAYGLIYDKDTNIWKSTRFGYH